LTPPPPEKLPGYATAWRVKNNQEVNDVLKGQNIGFIKKPRLNWLGHVECLTENNNMQNITRWRPMSERQSEDKNALGR
jgi:hypothetical protein